MNILQAFYLFVLFMGVVFLVWWLMGRFLPRRTQKRLDHLSDGEPVERQGVEVGAGAVKRPLFRLIEPIAKLSLPEEGWEKSYLRHRFMVAGFRGNKVPLIFFGTKTLLAFLPPLLFLAFKAGSGLVSGAQQTMFWLFLCAVVGYYLPNVYLSLRISRRQRELFESFPDALDLMTVCVEAGLSLDAAINRVGDEMRLESASLSEEFHLVAMELRAGGSRDRALRNLAMRTGLDDIDTLVAMLIQADRFGTSIAESLRVHAESLRTKRKFRAEEAATKLPVKLLFPLIFCIFPSLLLVLLGPAFISVYRILLPALTGQ